MNRAFDLLLACYPRRGFARQKHHADAVLARGRQRDAQFAARASKESVGQLQQDARAIALQRIGPRRAAMRQIDEDLQPLIDDGVTLASLDVCDKSETTSIVLA